MVPVSGLADGTLLLQRYLEGTETSPPTVDLTLDRCHRRSPHRVHPPLRIRAVVRHRRRDAPRRPDPPAVWPGRARAALRPGDRHYRARPASGAIGSPRPAWPMAGSSLASRRGRRGGSAEALSITAHLRPCRRHPRGADPAASTPATWGATERAVRVDEPSSRTARSSWPAASAAALDSARLVDPETGATQDVGPMLADQRAAVGHRPRRWPRAHRGRRDQSPDRTDPVPPAAELFDARGLR